MGRMEFDLRPRCAAGDDLRFFTLDDLVRGRSFSSIEPALNMSVAGQTVSRQRYLSTH